MKEQTWQERYREMQDNGVAFEFEGLMNKWIEKTCSFVGREKWYRIAEKQSIEGQKYLDSWKQLEKNHNMNKPEEPKKPLIPHIAERRLWLDQMEAGEPVEWQEFNARVLYYTYRTGDQPMWIDEFTYKPKPKTVKYYFALLKRQDATMCCEFSEVKDLILEIAASCGAQIIGDIEEREVEL